MSRETLLKGVEALLGCEKAVASGQVGAAPAIHRDAAIEQLKASPTPFRACCVDGHFCKRILVAIDDSQQAAWALQAGINLAEVCSACLGLVHVIHGQMSLTPEFALARADLAENNRRAGEELLRQGKAAVPTDLQVEMFLKVGDPSQQIITTAREWGTNLIVLGTHGRSGVSRMLTGSTAESVVRQAHCPVLTVGHDPADQKMREADPADVLTSFSPQCNACERSEPEAVT